jgi:hypothetical protein
MCIKENKRKKMLAEIEALLKSGDFQAAATALLAPTNQNSDTLPLIIQAAEQALDAAEARSTYHKVTLFFFFEYFCINVKNR